MTHDIHTLTEWIRVVALIAATCTTMVPILYLFFPWRSRLIGRIFMLQALSFAAVIDLSTLFSFWHPDDILLVFWIDAIVLTAVAVSTFAFAVLLWSVRPFLKKKDNLDAAEQ
jgi:hypothetical protein